MKLPRLPVNEEALRRRIADARAGLVQIPVEELWDCIERLLDEAEDQEEY